MHAARAAVVLQSVVRGRAARRRVASPFFQAAVRAGWLRLHVPNPRGIAKRVERRVERKTASVKSTEQTMPSGPTSGDRQQHKI